jgi:hypothetical protein
MFDILINIFGMYIDIYMISLYLMIGFLWFCLSFADRVHLRDRSRRIGLFIVYALFKIPTLKNIYLYMRYWTIRPLCTIFECITGFLEGIENFDPIISIVTDSVMDSSFNKVNRVVVTPNDDSQPISSTYKSMNDRIVVDCDVQSNYIDNKGMCTNTNAIYIKKSDQIYPNDFHEITTQLENHNHNNIISDDKINKSVIETTELFSIINKELQNEIQSSVEYSTDDSKSNSDESDDLHIKNSRSLATIPENTKTCEIYDSMTGHRNSYVRLTACGHTTIYGTGSNSKQMGKVIKDNFIDEKDNQNVQYKKPHKVSVKLARRKNTIEDT